MNTSIKQSEKKSDSSRTSSSQDLDWAIGWIRAFLQIIGVWTYPNHSLYFDTLSNIQVAFLALSIFFFLQLPQLMALIKVWGEVGLMIDNFTLHLPTILSELKLFVLWYKKKDLASIFATISHDWLEGKSSNERDVMMKYAKLSRLFIICGLIGTIQCLISYHVPLAFNIVMRTINNITDKPGALFVIQSVYFYDVTPPYIYRMTVLSQLMFNCLICLLYTGSDVLFGTIIAHLCGQLEILRYKVDNMANHQKKFQSVLKTIVQKHCSLIRYRDQSEDIFSALLLALIVLFSVVFCINSFQFISIFMDNTVIPFTQVAFYIIFVSCLIFLMFIYSWIGENLYNQCDLLYHSIYNCNWTTLTSNESSQITLLLIRTKNPLCITFGKFAPLTLNTFIQVCKTSCGWVSFLLTLKN